MDRANIHLIGRKKAIKIQISAKYSRNGERVFERQNRCFTVLKTSRLCAMPYFACVRKKEKANVQSESEQIKKTNMADGVNKAATPDGGKLSTRGGRHRRCRSHHHF